MDSRCIKNKIFFEELNYVNLCRYINSIANLRKVYNEAKQMSKIMQFINQKGMNK